MEDLIKCIENLGFPPSIELKIMAV
jgi:hypothetical protein